MRKWPSLRKKHFDATIASANGRCREYILGRRRQEEKQSGSIRRSIWTPPEATYHYIYTNMDKYIYYIPTGGKLQNSLFIKY